MTEIKDKLVTLEDLKTVTDNMSDILGINDMTTGINLLRGTRDCVEGTTIADGMTLNNRGGYTDGFFYRVKSGTEIKTDERFNYIRLTSTGSEVPLNSSLVFDVEPNAEYTYYADVRTSDTSVPRFYIGFGTKGSTQLKSYMSSPMSNTKQTPLEDGWIHISRTFKTPSDMTENDYMYFSVYNPASLPGVVDYRLLGLEYGAINNPIWSASPFDVAQDALAGDSPIYNLGLVDDAHSIPEGADLNTYITAGTYASKASANAPTLQNCPVSSNAFKLYVDNPTGGSASYVMQRLVIGHENALEYLRYSADKGSSWTDWRQTYGNTTVRPVAGGGTGDPTAKGARNNLFGSDVTADDDVRNDDIRFLQHKSNLADRVTYRTGTQVWNWIASKIRSVFGFTDDDKLPVERLSGTISLEDIYPVGSLYISKNSTSPASLFGGNWTQITGKFLRAANDISTGGSDTCTLTSAQMPSHRHSHPNDGQTWSATSHSASGTIYPYVSGTSNKLQIMAGSTTLSTQFNTIQSDNWQTNATGSGNSFNNMPAYQDLYVWERLQGALQGGGSAGAGAS